MCSFKSLNIHYSFTRRKNVDEILKSVPIVLSIYFIVTHTHAYIYTHTHIYIHTHAYIYIYSDVDKQIRDINSSWIPRGISMYLHVCDTYIHMQF